MKTFIIIVLFFLSGITFLSCSEDELGFSDAQKEIVGKWELVDAGDLLPPVGAFMRYEVYNIDGTFNIYYKGDDGQELVESSNSYVLKKAEDELVLPNRAMTSLCSLSDTCLSPNNNLDNQPSALSDRCGDGNR